MIQRILAAGTGAIVTFVLLLILNPANPANDPVSIYLTAVIGGFIGAMLWPVVAFFWARNRVKDRRDEQVQKEVERQMAEQNKG